MRNAVCVTVFLKTSTLKGWFYEHSLVCKKVYPPNIGWPPVVYQQEKGEIELFKENKHFQNRLTVMTSGAGT